MTIPAWITDLFYRYYDDFGFTTDRPNGKSGGNNLLWTALKLLSLLWVNKTIPVEEQNKFARIAQDCEHFDEPGILMRTPNNTFGQTGHDDTYAYGYISQRVGAEYLIDRWLLRGSKWTWWGFIPFKWVFNNVKPKKFSWIAWMGRYPWLICHMKLATRKDPDPHKFPPQLSWLEKRTWKKAQNRALKTMRAGKNIEGGVHSLLRNEVAIY